MSVERTTRLDHMFADGIPRFIGAMPLSLQHPHPHNPHVRRNEGKYTSPNTEADVREGERGNRCRFRIPTTTQSHHLHRPPPPRLPSPAIDLSRTSQAQACEHPRLRMRGAGEEGSPICTVVNLLHVLHQVAGLIKALRVRVSEPQTQTSAHTHTKNIKGNKGLD